MHLTPKNDQYPVALLAGGPADLAREIRDRLASKLGVLVTHHWEGDKPRQWHRPIPPDVDLVIFLKDFAGHSQHDLIMRQCAAQQVPVARTQRKWGTMYQMLHQQFGMSSAEAPVIPPEALNLRVTRPPDMPAPEFQEPPAVEIPQRIRRKHVRKPKAEAPTPTFAGPSEEAMVLIGRLKALASRDRFNVMITPEEITISSARKD